VNRKCSRKNGTGHQVPNQMVRSLHDTARCTKIHITFNVLKTVISDPFVHEVQDTSACTVLK
jgi:hypothetical protein